VQSSIGLASRLHPGEARDARTLAGDSYSLLPCFLKSALEILNAEGMNGARLLADHGIDLPEYSDTGKRIPIAVIGRAWRVVTANIDDPAIGVRAALRHFNPADWQSLGLAVLCSGTLRQALERVVRYFEIVSNAAELQLEENDKELIVVGRTYQDPQKVVWELLEFGLAALLVLLQQIYPARLRPNRIELIRPDNTVSDEFEALFGCPVVLGCQRERISFDLAVADCRLQGSNEALASYQDSYSEQYLASAYGGGATLIRVKREIMRLLPGKSPKLQDVAEELHVCGRQLQRRLAKKDTSFEKLVTDIRKQLALTYLEEDDQPLCEIAFLLGYSSQSNFTRAFRGWFGLTPTEFRDSAAAVRPL
jgi:AraC-like DNA-binding protein